uniref:NADH dehydrogenase subunit 6 n=1 Tax=Eucorydia linglong TaxID=3037041 RepID=UPI0027A1B782|nr:NADH dehydrogenase subunit 6 [Eucorydia linglong]WGO57818.1 NADH dehydrogenase subunit 6 [Eucorydia linglong]
MYMTFIMLSMVMSFIFMQTKHPLAMGFILLMQTILLCIITGLMSQTFWFTYILFLIFLGGMLVLFIYVTSLASNEMFKMSTKVMMTSLIPIIITIFDLNLFMNNPETTNSNNLINNELIYSLIKLYSEPNSFITIMLASYLFLTLIAVVNITNISMGPLRKSY